MPETALNGNLKGYVIQYWSAANPENKIELSVEDVQEATITGLKYDSVYFAQIRVENNKHRGPTSKIVEFRTSEGVPEAVANFQARSMGSSAFLLNWTKPEQSNGQIVGYNIYYEIEGGQSHERTPQISNPNVTEAILGNLNQNSTYRLHIAAVSTVGEGKEYVELVLFFRFSIRYQKMHTFFFNFQSSHSINHISFLNRSQFPHCIEHNVCR